MLISCGNGNAQNQINSFIKLPFGSHVLKTHKFPKHWDKPLDDTDKKHVSIHTKALTKIDDYYLSLGERKSIKGPIIQMPDYLVLGDDSLLIPMNENLRPTLNVGYRILVLMSVIINISKSRCRIIMNLKLNPTAQINCIWNMEIWYSIIQKLKRPGF